MSDPIRDAEERIRLGHGGGGRLTRQLIRGLFAASFGGEDGTGALDDAALLTGVCSDELAFTTDTFVVDPLFFPGGNIGDLAINGTVNDLAMRGARPLALSCAMVIEEGFELASLRRIVETMARATETAGVRVVTGDTKVVPRGGADGLYVNTSGIGEVPSERKVSSAGSRPGDVVLVSGPIGDHGIAVMSRRAGLSFEADIESDSASLNGLVETMFGATLGIHTLRDPTRGGLAAALCEIAEDSAVAVELDERDLPVRSVVHAACETLGLDPLHVPCEGRLVAIVEELATERLLEAMRAHPNGRDAAIVGRVTDGEPGRVTLRTTVGGRRLVDLPSGELLPRIC